MSGKRNRERFSIKFNENDPAHDTVIRLLEKQGPHRKAQFIVNAVLHYINCRETPDILSPQAIYRESIEEIIREILDRKGNEYPYQSSLADAGAEMLEKQISAGQKSKRGVEDAQKEVDQATLALIADTMSAFRNS
ncbi:hypothetical protein [Enterocloster clostridioformis]|uniref:Uncharacterized protein n=1 Tax=Enterocloster clostridioformis TaxID=1531 RepID=A0A2X2W8Y0_9FIRM|nr:hypothetical protein [Enterocloster clostridioformis]MCA5577301.1 hypothetical protein [Enterocloster clostridioformis]SQB10129.1 Uncharacterised protein [Enterocloster clostridioformis]